MLASLIAAATFTVTPTPADCLPADASYWATTWTVPDGFVPLDLRYSDNGDGTYTSTHQWNETTATFTGYVLDGAEAIVVTGEASKPADCPADWTQPEPTTSEAEPPVIDDDDDDDRKDKWDRRDRERDRWDHRRRWRHRC